MLILLKAESVPSAFVCHFCPKKNASTDMLTFYITLFFNYSAVSAGVASVAGAASVAASTGAGVSNAGAVGSGAFNSS